MYKDVEEVLAIRRGQPFTQQYIRGLPIGLKLSNGIVVGEQQSAQMRL
jgi:salicylate hydroxylase